MCVLDALVFDDGTTLDYDSYEPGKVHKIPIPKYIVVRMKNGSRIPVFTEPKAFGPDGSKFKIPHHHWISLAFAVTF